MRSQSRVFEKAVVFRAKNIKKHLWSTKTSVDKDG